MSSQSTLDFLSHLRAKEISVRSEGGQLRVSGPKNAISPELKAEIAQRKSELLALLSTLGSSTRPDLLAIKPEHREAEVPLSFAQQRLWFLDQLEPQAATYTISMAARIKGELDVPVLEKTISEIVRRHEILRTVFPSQSGWPHQEILPSTPLSIEVADLTQCPESDREVLAHRRIATEARRPFDLAVGPLFRTLLLQLGEGDHVLVITVHHTVFDGSSMNVFWREFELLYEAFRSGGQSPLPEPPVQYADFAQWQRRLLDGPLREAQTAYWQSQLQGNLPILELPADHSRQESQSPRGARERVTLDPAITESLKVLGQREGCSLFMTLLAAFHVLLYRITGQNDILVGTPIAGRNRTELETLIGFFVNTIVIRGQLTGDLSFREYLARVRNTVLDAHANQDLPFEELVGALDGKHDLNRTPLFQVFYNHLNLQRSLASVRGLQIEPFGEFEVESKFDLTLYSCEQDNSIDLLLLYNANLFDGRRISILLAEYAELLKQIGEDSSRSLDQYSLVTAAAAEVLPSPIAPLQVSWSNSVSAAFLKHADQNPERIAVKDSDGKWTYKELAQLSGGLAARLRSLGVDRGDTVAIVGHRSAPLVLAILGIMRAGAAFCILNPDYPATRLASYVRRIKPKAWIQTTAGGEPPQELLTALREFACERYVALSRSDQALSMPEIAGELESEIEVDPDSAAYLTFTSGTTAEPKCIVGTHRPISHFLNWHCTEFRFNEADRFSMLSGLAHDPLLRDVLTALWVGATVCVPPAEEFLSPGRLASWMNRQEITVTHLTPALSALLTEAGGRIGPYASSLPALRHVFFGGEVLLPSDVERMRKVAPNAEFVNFYGTTETPQAMAWHRIEKADEKAGKATRSIPLGRAIPDAQLLILNRTGGLAGLGELGEIHIRTPYLSQGYLGDERLTQDRFIPNPFTSASGDRLYRTGDLGRYRSDGVVEFAGRGDEQLKIRGYRVEPAEVEASLSTCPAVRACAVLARPDAVGSNYLVAYVVPMEGRVLLASELRDLLRTSLPDHMVPSSYITLDQLPLTPNGKIDRAALASIEPDPVTTAQKYVSPTGQIEQTIAGIWTDVLGIENVGAFDNFFDLGGHSLSATRLIARLRSAFGIEFPLRTIFQDPTIAGFASRIRHDGATNTYTYTGQSPSWTCLVPAQPRGNRIPLFLVAGYMGPDDTLLVLSRILPHLPPDQPVYGFKPRWIEGNQENYSSVDEAVREFLVELRMVQPKGPYMLGGYCVGGVVALEMARRLLEEGEEVGLLALIDTERPSSVRAFLADLRLAYQRGKHMASVISEISRGEHGPRLSAVLDLFQRKLNQRKSGNTELGADQAFYKSKIGYRRLVYGYSVKPFPGQITLFVNEIQYQIDRHLGWKRFATGGLAIKKVPGDHLSLLTDHAKEFGAMLTACLCSANTAPQLSNGRGAGA